MQTKMPVSSTTIETFNQWYCKLATLHVRGLVLAHPDDECYQQIIRELSHSVEIQYLDKENQSSTSRKVDSILGSEVEVLVFNALDDFDVNLFAAICGSLKGGGLLFLLVNPVALNYANMLSHDDTSESSTVISEQICPLLARVLRFYKNNSSSAIIFQKEFLFAESLFQKNDIKKLTNFPQQAESIERIIRVSNGHANRPLVMTANRGRGKSAALGIAAAKLTQTKQCHIIITAPQFVNLKSFYKHFYLTYHEAISTDKKNLKTIYFDNGSQLRFVPIDEIIRHLPKANLVIIDEAAAFPVTQLDQIINNYNRVVFSTTSDGYEGNGKGFEVRFKQRLLQQKPATRFITLEQTIRWSTDDEFEKSGYNALLLNYQLNPIGEESKFDMSQLKHQIISKTQLMNNEAALRDVFALLVNAHYQTRPADLKMMLTSPTNQVHAITINEKIIAVALVNFEGNISSQTCELIHKGDKRLKGELLAQSIVAHSGLIDAGALHFYRIMRIAVHPQLQSRGVGKQLIKTIINHAKNKNIDFVGASFAVANDITNFWLQLNFSCVRFSHSKDSSSGSHTMEVLRALSSTAVPHLNRLKERFQNALFFKLNNQLKTLDSEIVTTLLCNQIKLQEKNLSEYELTELEFFCLGKRGFPMVDDLIIKLFMSKLKDIKVTFSLTQPEITFLVDCLLKHHDFKLLASNHSLTGKKQSLNYLRTLIKKLLES